MYLDGTSSFLEKFYSSTHLDIEYWSFSFLKRQWHLDTCFSEDANYGMCLICQSPFSVMLIAKIPESFRHWFFSSFQPSWLHLLSFHLSISLDRVLYFHSLSFTLAFLPLTHPLLPWLPSALSCICPLSLNATFPLYPHQLPPTLCHPLFASSSAFLAFCCPPIALFCFIPSLLSYASSHQLLPHFFSLFLVLCLRNPSCVCLSLSVCWSLLSCPPVVLFLPLVGGLPPTLHICQLLFYTPPAFLPSQLHLFLPVFISPLSFPLSLCSWRLFPSLTLSSDT